MGGRQRQAEGRREAKGGWRRGRDAGRGKLVERRKEGRVRGRVRGGEKEFLLSLSSNGLLLGFNARTLINYHYASQNCNETGVQLTTTC